MAGVETAKGIFFPKIKYASAFDNFTPEIMNHYESFDESVSKVITELEAAYANPQELRITITSAFIILINYQKQFLMAN